MLGIVRTRSSFVHPGHLSQASSRRHDSSAVVASFDDQNAHHKRCYEIRCREGDGRTQHKRAATRRSASRPCSNRQQLVRGSCYIAVLRAWRRLISRRLGPPTGPRANRSCFGVAARLRTCGGPLLLRATFEFPERPAWATTGRYSGHDWLSLPLDFIFPSAETEKKR